MPIPQLNAYLLSKTSKCLPGSLGEIEALVENGANVNAIDASATFTTFTPILMAARVPELKVTAYPAKSLRDSAEQEAIKVVKYLVSKGADIHATDSTQNRRNALHLAATAGRPHMIRALVELGLDIDNPDALNATPLIHAAASGCIEAVKACVESGADINAVMNGNRTALDGAHEYNTREAYGMNMVVCKDHDEIIEYLMENGAVRGDEMK